jgi:hypothetical protein
LLRQIDFHAQELRIIDAALGWQANRPSKASVVAANGTRLK